MQVGAGTRRDDYLQIERLGLGVVRAAARQRVVDPVGHLLRQLEVEQVEQLEPPGELAAGVVFEGYLQIAHVYSVAAVPCFCARGGCAAARDGREGDRQGGSGPDQLQAPTHVPVSNQ